jgi:hypothetical protein
VADTHGDKSAKPGHPQRILTTYSTSKPVLSLVTVAQSAVRRRVRELPRNWAASNHASNRDKNMTRFPC